MPDLFATPDVDGPTREVLARIDDVRTGMDRYLHEPRRWMGGLSREVIARNVQASNSIEGYDASLDDVVLAIDGDEQVDSDAETANAVEGYRDAMTYVVQVAGDQSLRIDEGLVRALHFMMIRHDLTRSPGQWRTGDIFVHDGRSGEITYTGPDPQQVPRLMSTLIASIADPGEDTHSLVAGAMAHLNLVMIHPFRDGNGRMARALQTLVIARGGIVHPIFSSIEEYLGRNTDAYYRILAEVGRGAWNPHGDAAPWIRFCLTAHLRQATISLQRMRESEALWQACAHLVERHGLPERAIGALWDAARGLKVRRPGYIRLVQLTAGDEISDLTGSRDLKDLTTTGLLIPHGATRGRHYEASDELRRAWTDIRRQRPADLTADPFAP